MIPTIKAYRKSDKAKIINILMTYKQFSKQKKNFELTKATRNWTLSTKEQFFFWQEFFYKKKPRNLNVAWQRIKWTRRPWYISLLSYLSIW